MWLESIGVVSRKWVWVESMGVASGYGCKEVYRFPHIAYPYSSLRRPNVLQNVPIILFCTAYYFYLLFPF